MRDNKMFHSLAEARAVHRLYDQAQEEWTQGRMKSAFRSFLAASKAGLVPAYSFLASFYDQGEGTKKDEGKALHWYRRSYSAYRNRDQFSANNIGCILRDRGKVGQALKWFRRSVRAGNEDAYLNIALVYLRQKGDRGQAMRYLKKAARSNWAPEGSTEEAAHLLNKLKRRKSGS